MTNIVIIEKTGECKNINVKGKSLVDLSKKCNFRKLDNFEKRVSWKVKYKSNSLIVAVYAKNTGRANSENKFDMPPPIDSELYFGSIAVVAYKDKISENNSIDFNVDDWCNVYEKLMGGFIDLTNESEEETEEEFPEEEMSKDGYHKDGFIVDSEEGEGEGELANQSVKGVIEEESDSFTSGEETYTEYSEYTEGSETETEIEIEECEEEENIGSELSEEEYLTE